MFRLDNIIIYKSIIHTIYKEKETPELSSYVIDNDNEFLNNLFTNYIEKILKTNKIKWSNFTEDDKEFELIMETLRSDPSLFIDITQDIASILCQRTYKYMNFLSSFDLVCIFFEMNNLFYFGAIKLNHKNMYTRKSHIRNEGNINIILPDNNLYLSPKQAIEEGFVIELDSMSIALLDKIYTVEGDKYGFFGDLIFSLNKRLSEKEKLDIFNNINKRLQDKFIGEDLDQRANIKKAINDTLLETGNLDVNKAIDKAFDDDQEIKSIYSEAMKTANLFNEIIEIDNSSNRKKFDSQKIITNTGIEISIPIDYYSDKNKIEIISNDNGTITFIIKNIEEFKSL